MTGPELPDGPGVPDDFVAIGPPMARGASAVVWHARHRISGREVALKVWHRPLSTDVDRAQFGAESQLHQQLSGHPRIVRWLWAAAPSDAPAWMATELHGVSLSRLVETAGKPDLRAGVGIGLDLLDGLAAVHAAGIVHRDVTPANVLVGNGRAALCDLGIAMHVDSLSGDTGAGTVPYLAPELRRGSSVPDFRADVYSAARTIRQAVGDDVPDLLDALLTRAESEDPCDRPVDAADFRRRLKAVAVDLGLVVADDAAPADGGVTVPRSESAAGARVRPGGRHGRTAMLAAAVVAAAAGLVVGLVGLNDSADPAPGPIPGAQAVPPETTQTAPSDAAPPASPDAGRLASPDIDAAGRPVSLGKRDGGECGGSQLADGWYEHSVDGEVVAVTAVYFDAFREEVCAVLTKDPTRREYGHPTFVALTVCNEGGSCDSDWFNYEREAGPVRVPSTDGCVSWRASMQEGGAARWLIQDTVRQAGC